MIKIEQIVLSIAIGLFVFSCASKEQQSESTASNTDEWPEMDAFHMTMAEAFHPLKDSGNLEPANRLVSQMADEAEKWAASPLPEKVNNQEMKESLQKLSTDLRDLADKITNGAPADQVSTSLYAIHDQFHEIMEAWHGGNAKDKHQETR